MKLPKIALKWLSSHGARADGGPKPTDLAKQMIIDGHPDWASWYITRLMDSAQKLKYLIHASEMVLPYFEACAPTDRTMRTAIKAAKKCLTEDTEENRRVANEVAAAAAAANPPAGDGIVVAIAAAYFASSNIPQREFTTPLIHRTIINAFKSKEQLKEILGYGIKLLKEGENNGHSKKRNSKTHFHRALSHPPTPYTKM